jgi:hypothetical protein
VPNTLLALCNVFFWQFCNLQNWHGQTSPRGVPAPPS